jgi:hypothetical protein
MVKPNTSKKSTPKPLAKPPMIPKMEKVFPVKKSGGKCK